MITHNGSGMIGIVNLRTSKGRPRAMSDPSRRYSKLDLDRNMGGTFDRIISEMQIYRNRRAALLGIRPSLFNSLLTSSSVYEKCHTNP